MWSELKTPEGSDWPTIPWIWVTEPIAFTELTAEYVFNALGQLQVAQGHQEVDGKRLMFATQSHRVEPDVPEGQVRLVVRLEKDFNEAR